MNVDSLSVQVFEKCFFFIFKYFFKRNSQRRPGARRHWIDNGQRYLIHFEEAYETINQTEGKVVMDVV